MKKILAIVVAFLASISIAFAAVNVNTATKEELMTLKGIGDVTAKKIIKSRPYSGKDDLVKKKVITDKVYADIKDLIIAKQKK